MHSLEIKQNCFKHCISEFLIDMYSFSYFVRYILQCYSTQMYNS